MGEGTFPQVWRGLLIIAASLALAACNSQSTAQDTLDPNAITAPDVTAAPGQAAMPGGIPGQAAPAGQGGVAASQAGAPQAGTAATQSAGIASNARIHFAPIVGTSVDAAASLSGRLLSRARERGIQTVGDADPATTHLLKGYFTPLVEGKETTVIYVWDVYDPSGNRVHRISGQQKSTSKGGEGWAAVPPSTMLAIADATVEQLAAWLAARSG